MGCAIAAMHLTGMYPHWYRGKRFKKPIKIMVAGVDSKPQQETYYKRKLFGTNNKRLNADLGTGMIPRESIRFESMVTVRGDDIASCQIKT